MLRKFNASNEYFLASLLIFLVVTACGTPQNKQVIWTHPSKDASQFKIDKSSCEKVGFDAAGPKPTLERVPICSGRRGRSMMASSSCASAQYRVNQSNARLYKVWLSDFESGYNSCLLEEGYKLQTDQ